MMRGQISETEAAYIKSLLDGCGYGFREGGILVDQDGRAYLICDAIGEDDGED